MIQIQSPYFAFLLVVVVLTVALLLSNYLATQLQRLRAWVLPGWFSPRVTNTHLLLSIHRVRVDVEQLLADDNRNPFHAIPPQRVLLAVDSEGCPDFQIPAGCHHLTFQGEPDELWVNLRDGIVVWYHIDNRRHFHTHIMHPSPAVLTLALRYDIPAHYPETRRWLLEGKP